MPAFDRDPIPAMQHSFARLRGGVLQSVAAIMLLSALPVAARAQQGYALIVNAANPTSSLTREQAAKLFLRKTSAWESGEPAAPVDLGEGAPARAAFSREVLGKTVSAVKSYWLQAIYSGGTPPPPEKATDGDVVAYVRANPNAIGYIAVASSGPPAGVKIVTLR
jgi:ABC-type phosphate transport system substrate-binding protein